MSSLNDSIREISDERPATYDDYLQAQKSMSFKKRKKQVSFRESDQNSAEQRSSPDDSKPPPAESEKDLRNRASLLKRMSVRASLQDSSVLDSMVHQLERQLKKLDADGTFRDTGALKIPWYAPPIQRQRWGDEHALPIVNHGILFFDLFFVGGIFNLGELITSGVRTDNGDDDSEDRLRTILFFLGIFGPFFSTWENGVYYQSRYLVADYAHQAFELLRFFSVAAIVLFIRSLHELRDPQGSASVFVLVLAFLCESLMQLALDVEVYYRAQGDREAIKNHTWAEMKRGIIPACVTYFISTIIAGVFYFGPFEPLNNGAIWNVTDLPLTLTAAGYLWNLLTQISRTLYRPRGTADIRKTFVPYNIDFVVQRYSDWFLLLLGETVMAMVETTASERNYVITVVGSLILIVMFTLKFESEPENPHGHALWRSTTNAYAFRVLTEFLSIGIIAMSVTFKLIETEGYFGLSERHCTIALTVSLAWVLTCLELSLVTHKGLSKTWKRLFRPNEDNTKVSFYWPLAGITLLKVALLIFLFAIPAWQDDVNIAIILAFFVVSSIAVTRIIGWAFVFKEDEIKEMMRNAKQKLRSMNSQEAVGDVDNLSTVDEETGSVASSNSLQRPLTNTYHGMFDAVIFADYEGSIVSVNDVAVKMFRYEAKSDMIGENVSTLVGGGQAQHHAGYMKKFRERGNSLIFGKQRRMKARRSNGKEFSCIIGLRQAGNGKHLVGFIRDLEDFEEDDDNLLFEEHELKTQKHLKRVLDDSSFDSIAVIDLDGNIMGVNRTFVEEFRYDSKEEVLGLDIGIIMGSHHKTIHTKMLARYRETKKMGETMHCKVVGKQNLLPVLRKDGTEFKCIIGVNAIEDSDLLVGYIKNVAALLP